MGRLNETVAKVENNLSPVEIGRLKLDAKRINKETGIGIMEAERQAVGEEIKRLRGERNQVVNVITKHHSQLIKNAKEKGWEPPVAKGQEQPTERAKLPQYEESEVQRYVSSYESYPERNKKQRRDVLEYINSQKAGSLSAQDRANAAEAHRRITGQPVEQAVQQPAGGAVLDPSYGTAKPSQMAGSETLPVGRSDLANMGTTPASRALITALDHADVPPVPETRASWEAEGQKLVSTFEGRQKILANMEARKTAQSPGEQAARKFLVDEAAQRSMENLDNREAFDNAIHLRELYRESGTEESRTFAARADADKVNRWNESMGNYIKDHITTPPPEIGKKPTAITKWHKEARKLARKLKKQGIDINNLPGFEELYTTDRATFMKIMRAIREMKAGSSTFLQKLQEYHRNSLMSIPKTTARNILGALHAQVDALMVKPLARLMRGGWGETSAALKAMYLSKNSWSRAIQNLCDTAAYEVPALETSLWAESVIRQSKDTDFRDLIKDVEQYHTGKIKGPLGRVVRLSQNFNAAVDEFVKTMHLHGEAAAQAIILGKKQGLKAGSPEMDAYVDEQLSDMSSESFVKAVESNETWRVTFQGKTGPVEKAAIFVQNLPSKRYPMGWPVVPFAKIGPQLYGQAAMLTPLGAPVVAGRALAKALGVNADYDSQQFTRDLSRQILGFGGLMLVKALMYDDDGRRKITGSPDYRNRGENDLNKEIEPPNSIRIGNTWVTYLGVSPLDQILGIAIIALDAWDNIDPEKPGSKRGELYKAASRIGSMMSDATVFRTLGDIYKAWNDPERYGDRLAVDIASTFIPLGISGFLKAQDQYIREQRPFGDEDEKPGFGKQLARDTGFFDGVPPRPKFNYWGKPTTKFAADRPTTMFALNYFSPVILRNAPDPSDWKTRTLHMLARWNVEHKYPKDQVWIRDPSPYFEYVLEDGRVTKKRGMLNEDEYYTLGILSGRLREKMMNPTYMQKNFHRTFNYENPAVEDIVWFTKIDQFCDSAAKRYLAGAKKMRKVTGKQEDYDELYDQMLQNLTLEDASTGGILRELVPK